MSATFVGLATPEDIARYEPVIGLEVHVQLATATKIFCSCPTSFGAQPNSNVCPVCLGLPGALPVLSRKAVDLAIRGALALGCEIRPMSRFARKNYFYPDLPKGYQISQYDEPLAEHGKVEIEPGRWIGVTRVHMRTDAGKGIHDGFRDSDRYSYVDLNRCGTPLIEIVSEPDMRSADEAYAYVNELKQRLQFVEVSTCDMEKGHLRVDANVSVRPWGQEKFGTRAEVKNVNSFRFLKQAIEFEIERQVGILESGGRIVQETRLFDPDRGETFSMRSKEDAQDYRYFPEPDLLPLVLDDAFLDACQASLPELPDAKRRRYESDLGLSAYNAAVLTADADTARWFEALLAESARGQKKGEQEVARATANWLISDLFGALNRLGKSVDESPVSPEQGAELLALVGDGTLSGSLGKQVFEI